MCVYVRAAEMRQQEWKNDSDKEKKGKQKKLKRSRGMP